jgi:hypothetical protein
MSDLCLGPFAVTPEGALLPRPEAVRRPSLRFAWRGRPCEAAIEADAVTLTAIAGRIPSTAEPGADRRGALSAVALLPSSLPEGWRLRLTPDHRLRLETEASLAAPPTAVRLVAEMVRFVLALDPCLDRLEAVGATPGRRVAHEAVH